MKKDKLKLRVISNLEVEVLPDENLEFLMTTREVANGYGTSKYAIQMALLRHNDEFIEGKHFIKDSNKMLPFHKGSGFHPNQNFWIKTGVVRLGFFIKSEQARLFRDWAENLILKLDEQVDLFGERVASPIIPTPRKKRHHNRITSVRLIDLLSDVALIDDKELRVRITNKLLNK